MAAPATPSHRALNRATLARQGLLRRERVGVADAVRRALALQAQEPAAPYVALWNRVAGLTPADVDAAFAAGEIVKAQLLRITLHVVHADDHPAVHGALVASLRGSRLNDRRLTDTGVTKADVDAVLPRLLALAAEPRTVAEISALVAAHVPDAHLPGRTERTWWALRTFAPLLHVPVDAPWSFAGPSTYVTAPGPAVEPDAAAATLLVRYLEAFGPATAADFAQFTILRRPAVERAIAAAADRIVTHRPEGRGPALLDVPGGAVPDEDVPAPPRLLGMWDEVLLAYADRDRVIPAEYRAHAIRRNGDVLPTLLVDGRVAGVWRPVAGGIEATAFHRLDDDAWAGLAAEARSLVAFLAGREPAAFARYGHWWDKGMPAAEVRLLPG